jgi:integrase
MAIVKRLRADGSPAYRVVVHSAASGKHVTIGTFDRKKDAELAEAEYKRQSKFDGVVHVPKRITFLDLSTEWLNTRRVKPQTLRAYRSYREQMVDFFGATEITRIDRSSCERFMSFLHSSELAPTTANYVFRLFRSVMEYAVECRYLRENPSRYVKSVAVRQKKDLRVIAPKDHVRLVEAAPEHSRTLIRVWVFVGLRVGEMLALRWSDIDLENNCLHVRQQLITNGGRRFDELKTEASRRTVYFPASVGEALAQHKRDLIRECNLGTLDLVFPSPWGEPWTYVSLLKHVIVPLRALDGMESLKTHDFRHTFVSYSIAQGGHAKASITLDVYGHLFKSDKASYAERLGDWYVAATLPRNEEAQVVGL